ncbi:dTDP-4-dehydrorhamnose reductase [Kingella potus]|uniref:dTDP-4-dehydrorhamnose reductase n=1 Tax=Kingella potus TaxID=265175 RepID=A0A377QY53_9NEIS|nr:dTDP-4-dehydrorhamnose reductase [Kingella potus]STR00314.1 dTDP-4-dehydrorhamnose reductase [Kingella potus]
MNILLAGAAGQVGRELVSRLENRANLLAAGRDTLDITDRNAVFQTASSLRPDIIINAAAYTAVDKAENDAAAAYAVNRDAVRHLAEAAAAHNAAFIHLSTDYVFDGTANRPYRETDPVHPQSIYGQSKLAGEQAAAACARHIILRTAWVFGAHGGNFVKTMLRLGRERDSLGIVADQHGAPTPAAAIAAAIVTIAGRSRDPDFADWGIYHFSGSPYTTWHGFAAEIFAQAVKQNILPHAPQLNAIATADYPTPARRPADSRLDCAKIHEVFGIPPANWQAALANLHPYLPAAPHNAPQ